MSYRRADNLDKNIVFQEYFNSEQETRRNSGVPSGTVVFNQGLAEFTTDGKITTSNPVYGIKSIRLIVDLDTITEDIVQLSASHSIEAASGTVTATGVSSPTIYINGSAGATIDTNKAEIVVTTATAFTADAIIIGYISAYLEGKIELLEFYNKALTDDEVLNLYNDARYKIPSFEHKQQLGDNIITNGGASGATDWVDTNADGVADGFTSTNVSGCSIVTGNGFTGNAQRLEHDGASGQLGFTVVSGQAYNMSFKYRGEYLYMSGALPTGLLANVTGDATSYSVTFVAASASAAFSCTSSGRWGEIDELELIPINVAAVSKIIHVTSARGFARNLLSNSYWGTNVIPEASSSFETDGTSYWGLYNTTTAWNSDTKDMTATRAASTSYGIVKATILPQYTLVRMKFRAKSSNVSGKAFVLANDWQNLTTETNPNLTTEYQDYVFQGEIKRSGGTLYIYITDSTVGGEITFDDIIIERIVPEVEQRQITYSRDGRVVSTEFNGAATGSSIGCGSYHDLTGDITVLAWIKPRGYGYANGGMIVHTDKFWLSVNGSGADGLRTQNDGVTNRYWSNSMSLNEWTCLIMTRTAAGVTAMYKNSVLVTATTGSDGTPVAATTRITVGNNNANTRAFLGSIPEAIIVSGLLTTAEISQYYNATKHLYNK